MDLNLTWLQIHDDESAVAESAVGEEEDDGAKLFVRFVNKNRS